MSQPGQRQLMIGTRRSALALEQARMVRLALEHQGVTVEVAEIVTSGDKKQTAGEEVVRDKKDWILEIEAALLGKEIDLAVHSGKDVPSDIAAGTVLVPVLERATPYDVLICRLQSPDVRTQSGGAMLATLPPAATIGTASLRRGTQLRRLRPDIVLKPLRGNVTTRLEKLERETDFDAIVLAYAGLERLALTKKHYSLFLPTELVPAVHQGMLVVQYRSDDALVAGIVRPLVHLASETAWQAERACIAALGADCGSAVGVYAEVLQSNELELTARVLSADAGICIDAVIRGSTAAPEELGRALARDLFSKGAQKLL